MTDDIAGGVALSGVRHAYASSQVFADFRPVFVTVRHCARHHYCALLYGEICVCRYRVSLSIFAFFDRFIPSCNVDYEVGLCTV